MRVGCVISYKESFFSFKGNKILIKLKTPVFQVVVQDKGVTCISKKIEFYLSQDLKDVEAKVMGKDYKIVQLRVLYADLKSNLWISAQMDSGDLQEKLRGIAETCDGKALFANDFAALLDSFNEIQKYSTQESIKSKSVIKEYCDKNIELLNNQIRLLTADKNLYQELLTTL